MERKEAGRENNRCAMNMHDIYTELILLNINFESETMESLSLLSLLDCSTNP